MTFINLQHIWLQIYRAEAVRSIWKIHRVGSINKKTTKHWRKSVLRKLKISLHDRDYRCKEKLKSAQQFSADWSNYFILTVLILFSRQYLDANMILHIVWLHIYTLLYISICIVIIVKNLHWVQKNARALLNLNIFKVLHQHSAMFTV